jgi:hypothetical protein
MRGEEELTRLFTEYFGDRLSAVQVDSLVADVRASVQNRRARIPATAQAVTSPQPGQSTQF